MYTQANNYDRYLKIIKISLDMVIYRYDEAI